MLLGSGCFWSKEFYLGQLKGVISTHVGFAGGNLSAPSYRQVCGKQTEHAEVVRVAYDRRQLQLEQLLQYFFQLHDPRRDRRGNGGQYRSAIFFPPDIETKEDFALAKSMLDHLETTIGPIFTELASAVPFHPATGRHQQYCTTRGIAPRPPTGLGNEAWKGFKSSKI